MKDKRGFSLIELMAILIIIGLILIVAIPAVSRLLTSNDTKQYKNYVSIIREGANVYAEYQKDDLGGSNDVGCVDLEIKDLINENYIKEFNDKKVTCSGDVRIKNNKGNIKVSIDIECYHDDGEERKLVFEKKEIDQSDTCQSFEHIEAENYISLKQNILNDNNEQSDSRIDFSKISSDTNGKGLYYTNKNTEDNKVTYYFRGNVDNNYVKFAGFYWKVIRINEDGSIRLIYLGTDINATGVDTRISKLEFNPNYKDSAKYVGYTYDTNTDSSIKKELDSWYLTNLLKYSSYLVDAGFCNDRSIDSGAGTTNLMYKGRTRIYNNNPQFKCNNNVDLFTTSTSSKGNKLLKYPIGLITADEVMYAGGGSFDAEANSNYYLHTGAQYWTMTPNGYNTEDTNVGLSANIWVVNGNGAMYRNPVTEVIVDGESKGGMNGVRPVINLNGDLKISNASDNGTKEKPYIIKTN